MGVAAQTKLYARQAAENMEKLRGDPHMWSIAQTALQKGWMTDFMSQKRGRCKCKKCEVYVWRPQKLSSCAARDVPVHCMVCGCHPSSHQEHGFATLEDLA